MYMYTPFFLNRIEFTTWTIRFSGTEPSSVILSQTGSLKGLKSNDQKVPKQAEAKRDGVINPQNLKFQSI